MSSANRPKVGDLVDYEGEIMRLVIEPMDSEDFWTAVDSVGNYHAMRKAFKVVGEVKND